MKIGVIGDIHAEDAILESAMGFLCEKKAARILCVGDIIDGTGDANKCLDMLREANAAVVAGNHERWLLEDDGFRDWPGVTDLNDISPENLEMIKSLPATIRINTPCGRMLLCHGLGKNDMARLHPFDMGYAIEVNEDLQILLAENRYKYVVSGHTHHRMFRKFGPMTFVNAGTLKRDCSPVFLTIDFNSRMLQFYKIDSDIRKSECHMLD